MKSFFVHQHDSMQCGIACLQMICKYFGKSYSSSYISNYCFATTEGVSLLGISEAAEKLGLTSQCGKISLDDLSREFLPCILHWNQNHFVVLYKIKSGKFFYIADPGKGLIKYTKEQLISHWATIDAGEKKKGIILFLKPSLEFGKQRETDRMQSRSFKLLFKYILQYKKYLAQIIVGLLLGCILQLIMPFLTQSIVDIGIKHSDINFIWLVLLGELMIVVGRASMDFVRRWLLLHISMRVNISLVSDFFIKLLKLPMSFFDTKLLGDLLQRMDDHSRVQAFLTSQTLSVVFSILSFFVFGIVLFIYDKVIFTIFMFGGAIYGIWGGSFLQKRKIVDYELFEQLAKSNSKTYQFITAMQEIKLQNCEQRRRWEWEDIQGDLFVIQMKSLKLQQYQEAGSIFINEIKNILITVCAATAVIDGSISLGAMLAIQYIVGQLNSPIDQLMKFVYSLQDVKISLERINEIHEVKNEESEERRICSITKAKDIKMSSVYFKYNPHHPNNTLSDISLYIPESKTTAIVGASGSGKTTLIKLLLGYYPVQSGEIKIAGMNLNEYNLKWWRKQCGVVMQDGVIFSESIARNIAVDDGDIDVERLERAAQIANIHDYIMSLPLKYNTIVGRDGVGLSQGQKQRILIARAVYKNPTFIFLDEATNALDAKNERNIVENLEKFYEGRTVVVVAHRLSTVKNADQIIVMEKGKIVETGNHTSLIKNKGVYYNLVKNQLELGN